MTAPELHRKVLVGSVDGERGRDAMALGRILAKAQGAKLCVSRAEEGEDLAMMARYEGADLVVLGSTHRGPLGQIVPGTTMEHVLADAACIVAVAPPGFADRAASEGWSPLEGEAEDAGMRVIGVGFDGTPAARRALKLATELALRNGAALRVYSVAERVEAVRAGAPRTPAQLAKTELGRRQAELHDTVAELPPEVRALPVVLRGFAADALVGAASFGLDLMVLGTHIGGHVHRMFHKSVAGAVAVGARCPVLICPTPIAAPATVA